MAQFDAVLNSINGRAAQNLERINKMSGSLKIGGWIAKWGSWQIFKHDISDKCNVVRAVSVSVDEGTPPCLHDDSTACIIQISGSSCIEINGEERVISAREIVSVQPGMRFIINPLETGSEFIMIVVPPTPVFDALMNASSLKDILGVCEGDSGGY